MSDDRPDAIHAVAALDDKLRRGMYDYIRAARAPVSRDQAAAAVGISRKLAAFHLDKLVASGLLRAHYRPGGLRKVGRSPKLYEPAEVDIAVSFPERQHDLLAAILVDALQNADAAGTARQSALRSAHQRGQALATAERARLRTGRLGTERALTLSAELLDRHGYRPERTEPGCLSLHNCPFHPVVQQAPELVCGLNHAFLTGMLAGFGTRNVQAVLEPRPGECCVQLHANQPDRSSSRPGSQIVD